MAVYRFRVTFEEYDEVSRDIEIRATQTFADLHRAILASINFDNKNPASLFMSDEHWKTGEEFSTSDNKEGQKAPMGKARLTDYINDPHQKLYLVIESEPRWEFFVELFKIAKAEPGKEYPFCSKSIGQAPKQYGITMLGKEAKEIDFLNETEYVANEDGVDGEDGVNSGPDGPEEPMPEELESSDGLSFGEESFGEAEQEND